MSVCTYFPIVYMSYEDGLQSFLQVLHAQDVAWDQGIDVECRSPAAWRHFVRHATSDNPMIRMGTGNVFSFLV